MKPVSPVFSAGLAVLEKVYAEDQPEYVPLPALVCGDGLVITRWKLTWRERFRLLFSGSLWLLALTFNKPLQPVKLLVQKPNLSYDLEQGLQYNDSD